MHVSPRRAEPLILHKYKWMLANGITHARIASNGYSVALGKVRHVDQPAHEEAKRSDDWIGVTVGCARLEALSDRGETRTDCPRLGIAPRKGSEKRPLALDDATRYSGRFATEWRARIAYCNDHLYRVCSEQ
jgi:hypothetical protein